MKTNYANSEAASVTVELTLDDLQALRRVIAQSLEGENAPYRARGLSRDVDNALSRLAADMRSTADAIERGSL